MLVSDFDFDLPDALIAQDAAPRGASRLLVLDRSTGATVDAGVADLPTFLRAGDLLVVNDTRVFPARLLGRRVPSGGAVECLLLGESGRDQATWDALMHPGQKLKPGSLVRFEGEAGVLMGEVLARRFQGRRTVRLWSETGAGVSALVDALGHVPLPPYINRPDTPADRERYQTVFARVRGSVAAPTAGLHFTGEILDRLRASGVERVPITLHVGYGTFKPVKVDRVEDHVVDPEPYTIRRGCRRCHQPRLQRAPPRDRGRDDDDARAGGWGAPRERPGHGRVRVRRDVHLSRLPLPGDRRPGHQLSPAEVVLAHARERVRGTRERARRVSSRRRTAVPLLQLWRCHAGDLRTVVRWSGCPMVRATGPRTTGPRLCYTH